MEKKVGIFKLCILYYFFSEVKPFSNSVVWIVKYLKSAQSKTLVQQKYKSCNMYNEKRDASQANLTSFNWYRFVGLVGTWKPRVMWVREFLGSIYSRGQIKDLQLGIWRFFLWARTSQLWVRIMFFDRVTCLSVVPWKSICKIQLSMSG